MVVQVSRISKWAESSRKCAINRLHATDWPGSDVSQWVMRATFRNKTSHLWKPGNDENGYAQVPSIFVFVLHKNVTGPCYNTTTHIEVVINYNGKESKLSRVTLSRCWWKRGYFLHVKIILRTEILHTWLKPWLSLRSKLVEVWKQKLNHRPKDGDILPMSPSLLQRKKYQNTAKRN